MPGSRTRCATCTKQFRMPEGTTETRCSTCRSGAVRPIRVSAPVESPSGMGDVESSTLEALSAAGRDRTPLGRVTLKLAREFDLSEGVAAQRIADGLRKSLFEALDGAQPPADALDDLRRRREAKAAGA